MESDRETIEVPAGERWRVNECGCELVASNETEVAARSNGGSRSLTVATGRPKCKKVDFVTHWGIYPPNCTRVGGPSPHYGDTRVADVGQGPRPVMGYHAVDKWDGKPLPAGCLTCGGVREQGRLHSCLKCYTGGNATNCEALWQAWKAGARDFPRPAPGEGAPAHGEPDGEGIRLCRICKGVTVLSSAANDPCTGPAPAVIASKPPLPGCTWKTQRREVSTNGRDWLDYDRLTDSDAFDSYRHRRVDGVVQAVAEARGYGGDTWSNHVYMDIQQRAYMDVRTATRIPKDPGALTPWLSTDDKPAQRRAYATPSASALGQGERSDGKAQNLTPNPSEPTS